MKEAIAASTAMMINTASITPVAMTEAAYPVNQVPGDETIQTEADSHDGQS
jgi:hypothetical protein